MCTGADQGRPAGTAGPGGTLRLRHAILPEHPAVPGAPDQTHTRGSRQEHQNRGEGCHPERLQAVAAASVHSGERGRGLALAVFRSICEGCLHAATCSCVQRLELSAGLPRPLTCKVHSAEGSACLWCFPMVLGMSLTPGHLQQLQVCMSSGQHTWQTRLPLLSTFHLLAFIAGCFRASDFSTSFLVIPHAVAMLNSPSEKYGHPRSFTIHRIFPTPRAGGFLGLQHTTSIQRMC